MITSKFDLLMLEKLGYPLPGGVPLLGCLTYSSSPSSKLPCVVLLNRRVHRRSSLAMVKPISHVRGAPRQRHHAHDSGAPVKFCKIQSFVPKLGRATSTAPPGLRIPYFYVLLPSRPSADRCLRIRTVRRYCKAAVCKVLCTLPPVCAQAKAGLCRRQSQSGRRHSTCCAGRGDGRLGAVPWQVRNWCLWPAAHGWPTAARAGDQPAGF